MTDAVTSAARKPGLVKPRVRPDWFDAATTKLHDIANLKQNWDSYGALRPISQSLHGAAVLVHYTSQITGVPEPSIAPTANGNVCFEWVLSDRMLTVEVTPFGEANYYFETADRDEEGHDKPNYDKIVQFLTSW